MRIESSPLNLNAEASVAMLLQAVNDLEGKENPFLILSKNSTTYMQILWTPHGYILEYQDGSIAEHYVAEVLLSADTACSVLIEYLQGEQGWRSAYAFRNKKIGRRAWALGYHLGHLVGRIFALCRGV